MWMWIEMVWARLLRRKQRPHDPEREQRLREFLDAVDRLGFKQVPGKGRGVRERHISRQGLVRRLVVLESKAGVTMLVYCNDENGRESSLPFRFKLGEDYDKALRMIEDYFNLSDE